MRVDIVRAHGYMFAIVEVQNELTGNYSYHLRKVPEYNSKDEKIIRVNGKRINVAGNVDEFVKIESLRKEN